MRTHALIFPILFAAAVVSLSSPPPQDACGTGNSLLFSETAADGSRVEVRQDVQVKRSFSQWVLPMFDDNGNEIKSKAKTVVATDNGPLGGGYRYLIFRPPPLGGVQGGMQPCDVQTAVRCTAQLEDQNTTTTKVGAASGIASCGVCGADPLDQKGVFRTMLSAAFCSGRLGLPAWPPSARSEGKGEGRGISRVLVLGLGGGGVPLFLQRVWGAGRAAVTAVDISPTVIRAAKTCFDLGVMGAMGGARTAPRSGKTQHHSNNDDLNNLRVLQEDAGRYLRGSPDGHWDVVFVDIIGDSDGSLLLGTNHDNVPPQFCTAAFVATLRAKLKLGGAVVWNTFATTTLDKVVSGDPTDSSAEIQRLLLAGGFPSVSAGEFHGNRVFLASSQEDRVGSGSGSGSNGRPSGSLGAPPSSSCAPAALLADPSLAQTFLDWYSEAQFRRVFAPRQRTSKKPSMPAARGALRASTGSGRRGHT